MNSRLRGDSDSIRPGFGVLGDLLGVNLGGPYFGRHRKRWYKISWPEAAKFVENRGRIGEREKPSGTVGNGVGVAVNRRVVGSSPT